MNIKTFLQLIRRYYLLIFAGGLLTASAAYWLVSKQKPSFQSQALLSTGIISSVTIKNTGEGKSADRDYAQNELENLISLATAHQTRGELAARLLAHYLQLTDANANWISTEEFTFLQEEVFNDALLEIRDSTYAQTLSNIQAIRDGEQAHAVKDLIFSDDDYFGIDYIAERLQVFRKGNSDLLQFSYNTSDAAICKQTLNVLLDLFMEQHASFKKSQSSEVATYFADATQQSQQRLKTAEAQLLQFRVQNNIINYDEQTRTIAIRKEDLDELRFKENMNLQGTQATRSRVETELGDQNKLGTINEAMLSLRKELNQVSVQLAKIDITAEQVAPAAGLVRKQELESRREQLKQDMKRYAQQAYDFEQSPGGLQKQKLLDEWLATIVAQEQSNARLGVIDQRTQEFAGIYSQYAPWGSRLKELQREIDLAEDEYLENLHSYNQAMLHKQHTLMATNLELIDAPFLPIEKPDFKRFLLVIMAFMGGAFLVLASLLGLAFLDDSIQNPDIVRQKIGLEVATVLPNLAQGGKGRQATAIKEAARQQALALLLQQIKVETLQKDSQPKLILVASTRPEEGKSWVAQQTANFLRAEDNKVLFLYPVEGGVLPVSRGEDNLGYELSSRMLDADRLDALELFGTDSIFFEQFQYVVMEIPALLTGKYPLAMLRQFDLVLMVCRANRTWEEADLQALRTVQRASRSPIRVVLNGASMDTIETFMGELSVMESAPTVRKNGKMSALLQRLKG